jgi:hypothetical protein
MRAPWDPGIDVWISNAGISPILADEPRLVRLLAKFTVLRRIQAWLIGVGVRPEDVTAPPAGGRVGDSILAESGSSSA